MSTKNALAQPGVQVDRQEQQPLAKIHRLATPKHVYYEDKDNGSDDEAELGQSQVASFGYGNQHNLGMTLAVHRATADDMSVRRYDTFLNSNILDIYRAERVADPLNNPHTARVFAHFIAATGPSLSIFERHPRNTSAIFSESPVPSAQQGLWTYTLPMMALHHQGLLHAMLAISSFHMAKLSGASLTPSLKHYAYSLKRVHQCVARSQKRHQVATLAATLLLGFYETFGARHINWSTHLHGAKQLVEEIDYPGMVQEVRSIKLKREQEYQRGNNVNELQDYANDGAIIMHRQATSFVEAITMIDQILVDVLTGKKSPHGHFGRAAAEPAPRSPKSTFDMLDLRNFAIYQDLYWWYCKQDMIQCIVSGNRLLLNFKQFDDCRPRAPAGKSDAVYGSFDHLLLLLARIGDFAARDRARKIKAVAAAGGIWRPPLEGELSSKGDLPVTTHGIHSSDSHAAPRAPSHQQSVSMPAHAPSFYGLAPAPPQSHMPSAFASHHNQNSSSTPGSEEADLDMAFREAEEDWNHIRGAFDVFSKCLGPDFRPLPVELDPPTMTPFGLTINYRSYDISCLWLWYYLGLIMCVRAHPSMPPAMHMAAGVAARKTYQYANEIGRIAAGLGPATNLSTSVSPSVGAAFIESCLALFCAGVQYQNAGQREWTMNRLRDIESRTGWVTAGVIAHGLETGWERAAVAGRGPPYTRTKDVDHEDERVNGKGSHVTGGAAEGPHDRRFVHVYPQTRMYWAIGVIGEQEDLADDIGDLNLR